jgi:hypothetical protein
MHVGRIVERLGFDRRAEIALWVSWCTGRREHPDELAITSEPLEQWQPG